MASILPRSQCVKASKNPSYLLLHWCPGPEADNAVHHHPPPASAAAVRTDVLPGATTVPSTTSESPDAEGPYPTARVEKNKY